MEAVNSIQQMEASCIELKETISDYLTLLRLNIKASKIESLDESISKSIDSDFDDVANLYHDIEQKRLQLLIADQIVFEDIQLRRERMQEYEEKIQEKRRAVADKQAVFQGYTNPKKKRSQLVKLDEFERVKLVEKQLDNSKYLVEYERQLEEVKLLNDHIQQENQELQPFSNSINDYTRYCRKRTQFINEVIHSPETYAILLNSDVQGQESLWATKAHNLRRLHIQYCPVASNQRGVFELEELVDQIKQNKELIKSLRQQTELSEYLSEENASLISRYQAAQGEHLYDQKPSPKWHTESTNC